MLQDEFNKKMPEINAKNIIQISKLTKQIDSPEHGAIAIMKRDNSHVGLWLNFDGGGILHSLESTGVIFQNRASLNAAGWKKINYYRVN